MLLEFLYESLSDLSPLYLYLSVLLSMIFALRFMPFFMESFAENSKLYRQKLHARKAKLVQMQAPKTVLIEKRNWLSRKTKRIEAPDDDTDSESFLLQAINKKQGGTTWKSNLYSHSLRNIALSESFY
jgi:hypothetical protein